MHPSRDFVGITDICAPIIGRDGDAVASVIVSYVDRHGRPARHQRFGIDCGQLVQVSGPLSMVRRHDPDEHSDD